MTFIVACIAVTAASVAVVQFFIALDRSPRSAAEATWVVKLSHWTARTSRRSYARIAGLRHRRARADVDWSALPGSRPRRAPHGASAAMPLAAPSNGNGLPRPDRSHANGRAHWVWGTRPDFYAESDGSDRLDLEPSPDGHPAGWCTCDEATRKGDLVLVYRTAPRKDLRYLFEAESDAYPVDHRVAPSGGYGCDYRVLHRLDPGISLAELRADPVTGTWQPVRVNFRRSQPVPAEVWDRLAVMIGERDPRAGRVLREKACGPVRRGPRIERELENQLFDEPQRLRRIGLDVEAVGHHIRNPDGGLLDMLFRDRLNGDYVVVALKPGRGARATVTRLLEDVASVPDLFETPPSVRGLLIADDLDRRAELMLRGAGNLEFARLEDVGLRRHAGFADSRRGTASPNGEEARRDDSNLDRSRRDAPAPERVDHGSPGVGAPANGYRSRRMPAGTDESPCPRCGEAVSVTVTTADPGDQIAASGIECPNCGASLVRAVEGHTDSGWRLRGDADTGDASG